jgi:uncharacterized protein (TIGR03435 family)
MLRALLAERFKLDAGWQTREQPAYALVLARRDGRLGPGLKPSTEACDAEKAGRPPLDALREKALTAEEWTKLKRPVCDTVLQPFRARIQGGARTMGDLARVLSRLPALKAPVVDRTGLAGPFDFELSFNPDMSPAVGSPNVAANELPAPSLFVALQEQLGLKLESSRAPLEVLVIKHVERPSPD